MTKTLLIGLLAAAGAFAGITFNGASPRADEEVRCRVNAEALLSDLAKLSRPIDANEIKRLLKTP